MFGADAASRASALALREGLLGLFTSQDKAEEARLEAILAPREPWAPRRAQSAQHQQRSTGKRPAPPASPARKEHGTAGRPSPRPASGGQVQAQGVGTGRRTLAPTSQLQRLGSSQAAEATPQFLGHVWLPKGIVLDTPERRARLQQQAEAALVKQQRARPASARPAGTATPAASHEQPPPPSDKPLSVPPPADPLWCDWTSAVSADVHGKVKRANELSRTLGAHRRPFLHTTSC